jgi:hypothetical protein
MRSKPRFHHGLLADGYEWEASRYDQDAERLDWEA